MKPFCDIYYCEKRKGESPDAYAHFLLAYGFPKSFGIPYREEEIIRSDYGKPLHKKEGVHFSLSHGQQYVAIACANRPVGVDVESPRAVRESTMKRCCSDTEWEWLAAAPDRELAFLRLWTLKESYVKMTGEGLRANFSDVSFSLWKPTQNLISYGKEGSAAHKGTSCGKAGAIAHEITSRAEIGAIAHEITSRGEIGAIAKYGISCNKPGIASQYDISRANLGDSSQDDISRAKPSGPSQDDIPRAKPSGPSQDDIPCTKLGGSSQDANVDGILSVFLQMAPPPFWHVNPGTAMDEIAKIINPPEFLGML